MDMKELFNDFKNYVDAMDKEDILESIRSAMEHTVNSSMLDSNSGIINGDCIKSSTQEIRTVYVASNSFAFSSASIKCSQTSYTLSNLGGVAA